MIHLMLGLGASRCRNHRGGPLVFKAYLRYCINMKASTKKAIPKRRGRPATGKDASRTFRLSDEFMTNLEAWATANGVTRSEAIRRLVEIGLKTKGR
jgi:hypothetical protein